MSTTSGANPPQAVRQHAQLLDIEQVADLLSTTTRHVRRLVFERRGSLTLKVQAGLSASIRETWPGGSRSRRSGLRRSHSLIGIEIRHHAESEGGETRWLTFKRENGR